MDPKTMSMGHAWILAFAIAVCVVKGDYVVMVRTLNFGNPQSLLANRSCCDSCSVRGCDNRFEYCLRRNADSSDENCRLTTQINWNDSPLNFAEPTVLGLPNPLPLQGLTKEWNATQGVYFHLEVYDRDSQGTNGGVVIRAITALHLQVGEGTTSLIFSYQDNLRAWISLTFRVVCAEDYYGPDCSQFCMDNCVCDPGFTGEFCQTNIDDCVGVNCSGNGECLDGINSFVCNCSAGYNGTECDTDINECLSGDPCGINGHCENQDGSFNCSCDPGFTGELCQTNIDECIGVNCSGNGNCSDGSGTFTCNCFPGYTGTLCDSNIDECLSNPCGRNGQCVDGVDSFNCSCDPGFTGELCQTNIDDCVGVNCSGNGVCVDGVNSFTCQCSPGHSGTLCADEIQSSGVQAGPIVGGVLGVLISLILILVIVVAVVLTMRCLNRQGKENIQGRTVYSDALPGDNPVYDRGNTAVTLGGLTQASAPVHYVNVSSSDRDKMPGSAPDRIFDNPIYGGNDEETEGTYADPDANNHAGTGMGSAPYHEFDNPIYGGEADENSYSLLANSSTYSLLADSSTVNGTAASTGQAVYTNAKRGTRHWQ